MKRILPLSLGLALLVGCTEHGQPPLEPPLEPQLEVPPPQLALIVRDFTELSTLGGDFSRANAVNDHGQVVGVSDNGSFDQAFLWVNGAMHDLGRSHATDINELAEVVGFEESGPGMTRARLWTTSGGLFDPGSLGGPSASAAGINNLRQVVGTSRTSSGEDHAFLWDFGGVMQDLGTLGGASSVARAINDQGQVVGESTNGSGETRAFLWENGVMRDLGTLGGGSSFATDINELGQVVGSSTTSAGQPRAFLWENGVMRDLGIFTSFASGINDLGQVVGFRQLGSQVAFLWTDETMYELPGFDAADISNSGRVVGSHVTSAGQRGAVWDVPIRPPVDVQPADADNTVSLNPKGNGKSITVAILSNPYFTAQHVKPATVTLGDEQGSDTPVVRDKRGNPAAVYRDIDGDGDTDLMLEFATKEMVAKGDLRSSTTKLVLLGERTDGRPLRAVEPVTVVP